MATRVPGGDLDSRVQAVQFCPSCQKGPTQPDPELTVLTNATVTRVPASGGASPRRSNGSKPSSPVDLRQLAEEVVGSMAHLALAAGRTIALTGADHPVIVIGNAAAITDALRNLIENVFAHTLPGTEVVVDVDPTGAISVQDSGPGVPAEDRQRIFERFWRGKGVRSDGAGLGLAIVMEIVRAHGASVTVSNRIPRGARFDVRFRAA
jgi:two-component system sensor histidine kinase TctE